MFVKLPIIVISRTKLAEKTRLSEANTYIFYFAYLHDSQYYYLTLHSQRFATLPLVTPCRGGSCAIKREWGENPQLSRSCEPPLCTGANEKATEAMHLLAECVGMARMPYPPMLWEGVRVWAASQKTCRNMYCQGCSGAPRGLVRTTKPLQRPEGRIWLTAIIVPSCDYMYSVVITQL